MDSPNSDSLNILRNNAYKLYLELIGKAHVWRPDVLPTKQCITMVAEELRNLEMSDQDLMELIHSSTRVIEIEVNSTFTLESIDQDLLPPNLLENILIEWVIENHSHHPVHQFHLNLGGLN